MPCPTCGHENPLEARFCNGCGSQLAAACPACSRLNPPGSGFCNGCGQRLGGPVPAATGAAPPGQATQRRSPPLPSSFADGRYVVQSFLGEGGRKRVYLAHDTKLDRDVAFAAIKTEGLDEPGLSRAQREAQAMGRLGDHPHIVTIHDVGEESGQP